MGILTIINPSTGSQWFNQALPGSGGRRAPCDHADPSPHLLDGGLRSLLPS